MTRSLEFLFEPRRVAVIGASANPARPGYRFAKRLLDSRFPGSIYLINPSGGSLLGHQVHPTLDEVHADIDLALIMVAPERVEGVVENVGKRGVPFAVIFTSGFGEVGQTGIEAQDRIIQVARDHGVSIVGPNCMGLFNLTTGLNITGTPDVPQGNISVVSQSGNIGLTLFEEARKFGTGYSKFVHFGNQADISLHEYVAYLGDDSDTHAIVVYLEGLKAGTGGELLEVAQRVSLRKPIVAIKAGRGSAAQRAAQSHTGAMAGEAATYSALFEQAGIIEVERLDELLPVAETLIRCPPMYSDSVAIVGSGGGHSVLLTDALERRELTVPEFNQEVKGALRSVLPEWAPVSNPVDMTGVFTSDLTLFNGLNEMVLERQSGFGAIVNYGLFGAWPAGFSGDPHGNTYESVASDFGAQQARLGKPIVFYSPYAGADLACFSAMRIGGVPAYDSIERTATAVSALRQRGRFLSDHGFEETLPSVPHSMPEGRLNSIRSLVARGRARETRNLTEPEAYRILEAFDIPVVPYRAVDFSSDAASEAAASLGYPVVLKLVSPQQSHKTDVGGVFVDLRSEREVISAVGALRERLGRLSLEQDSLGLLVSRYMPGGQEILIGFLTDPHVGRLMMAGAGGVHAESLARTVVRILPLSDRQLAAMATEAANQALRRGTSHAADVQLARTLSALQDIALELPNIQELEINPLLSFADGVYAADARAFLSGDTHR